MVYERLYRLPLCLLKIGKIILNALVLSDIRKQSLRISQILVHIIEVSKDNVTPEYEVIQGLRTRMQSGIALVQLNKQSDPVRNLHRGILREHITHRHHLGSHYRSCPVSRNCLHQILLEKDQRTSVRENKATLGNPARLIVMICNLFKKWYHSFNIY